MLSHAKAPIGLSPHERNVSSAAGTDSLGPPSASKPPALRRPAQRRRFVGHVVLTTLGLVGLGVVLHRADLKLASLGAVSPQTWLMLAAASTLIQAIDATPLRLALLGTAARWRGILHVRIMSEAYTLALPAGVVVAETLKMRALKRRYGVAEAQTLSAGLVLRLGQGLAQLLYVALGALAGLQLLRSAGVHTTRFVAALMALGLTLFVVLAGLIVLARSGRLSSVVGAGLGRRLPEGWVSALEAFERHAATTLKSRQQTFMLTLTLFGGWVANGLETYLILWGLGAALPLADALTFDALASGARLLFFFVPAGLGAQDAWMLTLAGPFNIPMATVGQVIVLKRVRELSWVLIGLLLGARRSRQRRRPSDIAVQAAA